MPARNFSGHAAAYARRAKRAVAAGVSPRRIADELRRLLDQRLGGRVGVLQRLLHGFTGDRIDLEQSLVRVGEEEGGL